MNSQPLTADFERTRACTLLLKAHALQTSLWGSRSGQENGTPHNKVETMLDRIATEIEKRPEKIWTKANGRSYASTSGGAAEEGS